MTSLAALLLLLLPAVGPADSVRFTDPRISESSGLVDTGSALFTVNDSGHDPVLFQVDPATGDTVRTIRFAPSATDVEALAPQYRDVVWVGDIGDNQARRSHIDLLRVDLGSGAVRHRELRYPDGPRDAETLLVGRGGRVFVVTKGVRGEVYAAGPRDSVLRRVASVGMFLTDGALMPDGRHVLLRDYGNLHLYSFPGFEHLASMSLPSQPQGEGLSVSPSGRIRVSSEGVRSRVLGVRLSAEMEAALHPAAEATPTPTPAPPVSPPASPDPDATDSAWPSWAWASLVLLPISLLVAVGFAVGRRGRGM